MMKVKMYVQAGVQGGGIAIGSHALTSIEGLACTLATIPISPVSMVAECSEFIERADPVALRKPVSIAGAN